MITVLHVFGAMNRGGAELRTIELMPVLSDRFRFAFCTLSGVEGDLGAEVRDRGGSVHPCRLDLAFPARFASVLREVRPDVVHSHVHLSSGYVLAWAAAAGVRGRIAHLRSMGDGRPDSVRRRVQRRALRTLTERVATRVLAVSAGALDASWGARWRADPRFEVVYAGLDPTRFGVVDRAAVRADLGLNPDAPVWIHVGSQQAAKNHPRLIELFAAFASRRPDARLLLVGRTDTRIAATIDGLARSLGVADAITTLGERRDVPTLLGAADVLVFPSVREGLPGAVLEARAAGIPVVASDLPGILEIADHLRRVRCLSVQAETDAWVTAVEVALDAPRDPPGSAVVGTVFDVARSARRHAEIWSEEANRR